jgi:hypothetical protein
MSRLLALLCLALPLAACQPPRPDAAASVDTAVPEASVRVATFNVSLYSETAGGLVQRLREQDAEARKIAAVIQRVRPDVILLNEFDYDPAGEAAELFQSRFLAVGQFGEQPIEFRYRYLGPVNTGVPSGLDLDKDGRVGGNGRGYGNDAWGYGLHPGQYGMLVLSRFPIDEASVRSFQTLRWSNLPGARAPVSPDTGEPWYASEVWAQLRLSSKSHWDVPLDTPLGRIHLLAAHPTPPAFDGPERRNAARNHDEIRLWAEYLAPGEKPWLCDDAGVCGGLHANARFVIAGDYNADPGGGSSLPGAIQQLLESPRVLRMATPRSSGGLAEKPESHPRGNQTAADHHTANFGPDIGNYRVDYVLPSVGLNAIGSGVFWPRAGEPGADWVTASDHRLVWVDLAPVQ